MPDLKVNKAGLEADTDQSIQWARGMRASMTGPHGHAIREMANGMAEQLGIEFPGARTGRLTVAVASAVNALAAGLEDKGVRPTVDLLVTVATLAGERLDRERAVETAGEGGKP